eukprot:UN31885
MRDCSLFPIDNLPKLLNTTKALGGTGALYVQKNVKIQRTERLKFNVGDTVVATRNFQTNGGLVLMGTMMKISKIDEDFDCQVEIIEDSLAHEQSKSDYTQAIWIIRSDLNNIKKMSNKNDVAEYIKNINNQSFDVEPDPSEEKRHSLLEQSILQSSGVDKQLNIHQ